jgi:TetR/AcrR family transcriptional regulator, lmrAB and yxaGH operons repressor
MMIALHNEVQRFRQERAVTTAKAGPARTGTRERFLEGGTRLFRSQGFHATGVKQIAGLCGAPMGSLYHFFPGGKEQIALDGLRRSAAFYDDLMQRVFARYPDIGDAIAKWFSMAAGFLRDSGYADGCPVGTLADGIAATHDGLREAASAVMQSWERRIADRLAELGVTRPEAEELASYTVAAFEGAILLGRVHRSTAAVDRTSRVVAATLRRAVAGQPA